jgi:hypothetical protein
LAKEIKKNDLKTTIWPVPSANKTLGRTAEVFRQCFHCVHRPKKKKAQTELNITCFHEYQGLNPT